MKKNWNFYRFGIIIAFLQCFHLSAFAQANIDGISKDVAIDQTIEERSRSYSLYGSYMLGPGDTVGVELLDIPEYSGVATIGPDGTIYLPRLRSIYVEGYTIEELQEKLTELYTQYVIDPQVYVNTITYRPIRVYVGGEVQRPGYYYLTGQQGTINLSNKSGYNQNVSEGLSSSRNLRNENLPFVNNGVSVNGSNLGQGLKLPTLFDALRTAGGVTPFSKLNEVTVTRNQPLSDGGGKIQAKLDFLELLTTGNETSNIRLLDGDSIFVARSPVELREQIVKAGQTNLSPDFVQVFVTGRVREPGLKILPQGATLDQAIASGGGLKILRGRVEFLRFNRDGSTDRRKFFIGGTNKSGSYKNPVLMGGDIVRVNESPLSATLTVPVS